MKSTERILLVFLLIVCWTAHAQEKSPYMGGDVELIKAPNGAIVNAQVLVVSPKIMYIEPTTEKLADGLWCIGGY
jgi:hypothetical protein